MKILIIGLGNIGAMHGWALSQAGVDVTHVVRRGKRSMYDDGIKLDVLDLREGFQSGPAVYSPVVVEEVSPGDGFDLVLIATRYYQAADAVRQYAQVLPDASFLLFTSNWDGPGEIDGILPRSRYAWGYSAVNGGFDGDTLVVNMRSDFRLGRMDGNSEELIGSVIEVFGRAGLKPDMKEDIISWLWVHHATNAGFQGTAQYCGGIERLLSDPAMMVFMVYAVRDAFAVLSARGVDVMGYTDAVPFLERPVDEYSEQFAKGILDSEYGKRILRASHVKDNPEEMRRCYYDVLETGRQLGIKMPHLAVLKDRLDLLS